MHLSAMNLETMNVTHTEGDPSRKIALVDGMVLVQKLTKKTATVVTVKDLHQCFNTRLMFQTMMRSFWCLTLTRLAS